LHPAAPRQLTAGHIREPATEAGDGRRAGKRECQHRPRCPDALAPGRSAARVVADHPGQGWSLLICAFGLVLAVTHHTFAVS
jgi:hypothetical protein